MSEVLSALLDELPEFRVAMAIYEFIIYRLFKFEFPAACWSVTEIPTLGAARDEFK